MGIVLKTVGLDGGGHLGSGYRWRREARTEPGALQPWETEEQEEETAEPEEQEVRWEKNQEDVTSQKPDSK